ncbi:KaiC [Archaeoglobus fulgidus DSM 8774]|nr:KaiC [Archaeoglobus fulgidus DSM 8774]
MDFEKLEKTGSFKYVEMLAPTSEDALMQLSRELTKNALELKATRIVIDSISPILSMNPETARAILHNALKTISRELKSVVLMTEEMPIGETRIGQGIEEFVVDGVIVLRLEVPEAGAPVRTMSVLKLRGKPLDRAVYNFEIGPPSGVRVLMHGIEELESNIDFNNKIATGIDGFDELLGGGIIRGTATAFVGPSGGGKTVLMLSAAANVAINGENVTYISFEEPRQQIEETLKFLGYGEVEGLEILSLNPRMISLRALYDILSKTVLDHRTMLFIDGLNAIRREFGEAFHRVVRDVVFQMKKNGITVVISLIGGTIKETLLSTIVDNVVELRVVEKDGELRREIAVRKARMSRASNEVKRLVFDGKPAVR